MEPEVPWPLTQSFLGEARSAKGLWEIAFVISRSFSYILKDQARVYHSLYRGLRYVELR